MHRQGRKTVFRLTSGLLLAMLIALATLAGCKKERSEAPVPKDPPTGTSQSNQATEKVEQPTKQVTEPAEAVKPDLDRVVRAARYWGPAHQSWYGKQAPDFTLKDLAGNEHKLSDYRGKKVMIVFWATWCPPCRLETPDLIKLRNHFGQDKLAMLAISAEKPETVSRFVEMTKMNYTVLLDTGNMPTPFGFMQIYGSTGVPGSFFIDTEGKIRLGTTGLIPLEDMKKIVEAI